MIKRTWFWAVVGTALAVMLIVGLLKMNRHYEETTPLKHLPANAVAVLKVKSIDDFARTYTVLPYSADFGRATELSHLDSALVVMKALGRMAELQQPFMAEREMFASLINDTIDGGASWVFGVRVNNYIEGSNVSSALRRSEELLTSDTIAQGTSMLKVLMRNQMHFFVAVKGGCLFASPSANVVAQIVATRPKDVLFYDPTFSHLMRTAAGQALVSAYVNCAALDSVPVGGAAAKQLAKLGKWVEFDMEFAPKSIGANGFVAVGGNTIVSATAANRSRKQTICNRIPSLAQTFMAYSQAARGLTNNFFGRYLEQQGRKDQYVKQQEQMNTRLGVDVENRLATIFEGSMALFSTADSLSSRQNTCLILTADNATVCQASLNALLGVLRSKETPAQRAVLSPVPNVNVPVYEAFLPSDNLFFLAEMFPALPCQFYLRYENTLLFADSIDMLRRTLYEILLSRTFGNDADYRNFRMGFSEDNVFFYYSSSAAIKSFLQKENADGVLSAERQKALGSFYALGVQLSNLGNKPYITLGTTYEPSRIETPPTAWQNKLDAPLRGRPFAVQNHYTQETEYLVQDEQNKVYLINPKGLVLWSRSIGEPILGAVRQIDYYNNHKLQYLFATASQIHLIDRNGNNTAAFPIRLQQPAVSGVTYIDYGNPADFRLFVQCGDRMIRLYDREGKNIQGWEMLPTEGEVRGTISHWVSNNKDYLVFADSYRWYIVNRRGNERIALAPLAPNANSGLYLVRANTPTAAFVTSTAEAKFASINVADGNISRSDIGLPANTEHHFLRLPDGNRFAFVSARNLTIVDDHGKILSNNPLYLSSVAWAEVTAGGNLAVWDKDESLGYLISPQGKVIEGFPVPAASPLSIIKADGVTNVVVAARDGEICNYIK